jgi:hypothetical protein
MNEVEAKYKKELHRVTTPRAAAIAGILFGLLFTASLVLLRTAIPADPYSGTDWIEQGTQRITIALELMPFAGIAFLWFMGVIRDRLGEQEDRLFATVLLGSGLLFLAMTFTGAAISGGMLSTFQIEGNGMVEGGVYLFGREVIFQIINIYSIRMAGLFMISLGTIWLRTGLMHRGWAFVTYALALVLLLSISFAPWVPLILPGWVFAVSVYILILNFHDQALEEKNKI